MEITEVPSIQLFWLALQVVIDAVDMFSKKEKTWGWDQHGRGMLDHCRINLTRCVYCLVDINIRI